MTGDKRRRRDGVGRPAAAEWRELGENNDSQDYILTVGWLVDRPVRTAPAPVRSGPARRVVLVSAASEIDYYSATRTCTTNNDVIVRSYVRKINFGDAKA